MDVYYVERRSQLTARAKRPFVKAEETQPAEMLKAARPWLSTALTGSTFLFLLEQYPLFLAS